MAELLGQPFHKPHAYLIAGGGGGQRSTIILRMIACELTERGIPYTHVDGVYADGRTQAVKYPSWQERDMEESIGRHSEDTPLLFVSHCIGTVAALGVAEKLALTRQASIVSIAPPLPSPRNTTAHPQSQGRRIENDTFMRIVDLPEDAVDYTTKKESFAHIDPQYFADIYAADDLEQRLRARVEAGSAAVFAPEYDWNAASPLRVRAWHEDWDATLPTEEVVPLRSRAPIIYDAAHGLYLSSRGTRRDASTEENVRFQMANVNAVIDTGLQLLTNFRVLT